MSSRFPSTTPAPLGLTKSLPSLINNPGIAAAPGDPDQPQQVQCSCGKHVLLCPYKYTASVNGICVFVCVGSINQGAPGPAVITLQLQEGCWGKAGHSALGTNPQPRRLKEGWSSRARQPQRDVRVPNQHGVRLEVSVLQ